MNEDHQHNVNFYTDLLKEHGHDVKSLNWGSAASQHRRFEVLAEIADLNGSSILDVGCGLGDFYLWLNQTGKNAEYTGIDITPAMIEAAKKRFPEVEFSCLDLLEDKSFSPQSHDYIFASGIFYLRHHEPYAFMQDMIKHMYSLCKKGIAFNSLSTWMDSGEEEFRADPAQVLDFCKSLSPYATLRHDYHPGDFTVYLYREKVQR